MNEIYGGLSSSPVNKIDVAMSGDRTITFGGTVVETPIKVPEKIVFATISLQTDPVSTGTVTGGGVYQVGTQATVVATPDSESEYPEFDGWYEGETKVSENASYTFTVSGDCTLVAKFKEAASIDTGGEPKYFQAVNLGLPSGTLWANHNIGAINQEDRGVYFSWGNTTGHVGNGTNGKDAYGNPVSGTAADALFADDNYHFLTEDYSSTTGSGLTTDIPVNAEYDAAVAFLGGNWRLPTKEDFEELINNCDWTWKQVNGVNGYEVKSKASGNTNSIFLPASGYVDYQLWYVGEYGQYISSSNDSTSNHKGLRFYQGAHTVVGGPKYIGKTIRPVQKTSV